MRFINVVALVAVVALSASSARAGKFDKNVTEDEISSVSVVARLVSATEDDIHIQVPGRPKKDGTPTTRDERIAVYRVVAVDAFSKANRALTAVRNPDITKQIKALKPGDYFKFSPRKTDADWVAVIQPYKLKDGEDGPNSFVLKSTEKKKIEGDERIGLLLDRFGHGGVVWVPLVRRSGKMVNDPELAKRIESFATDDVLEVTVGQAGGLPVIATAFKYQPPRGIIFQELTKTTVGSAEYDAVAAQDGSENVTLLIPKLEEFGKFVTNRKLIGAFRTVKKGEVVACKTYSGEDDKIFIREAQGTGKTDITQVPGISIGGTAGNKTSDKTGKAGGIPPREPVDSAKLPREPVDSAKTPKEPVDSAKPALPAKKTEGNLPQEP